MVLLPEWSLRDYLQSKELIAVDLAHPVSVTRSDQIGIFMLYLQSRYQIPKIRLAADFIVERLTVDNMV